MSQVGSLVKSDDSFDGHVRTMKFAARFFLEKNENKFNDKSPDYLVMTRSAVDNEPVQIGGAKNEVKREAGKEDRHYMRLWLDDPDAPDWTRRLTAFPVDGSTTEFRIVT